MTWTWGCSFFTSPRRVVVHGPVVEGQRGPVVVLQWLPSIIQILSQGRQLWENYSVAMSTVFRLDENNSPGHSSVRRVACPAPTTALFRRTPGSSVSLRSGICQLSHWGKGWISISSKIFQNLSCIPHFWNELVEDDFYVYRGRFGPPPRSS